MVQPMKWDPEKLVEQRGGGTILHCPHEDTGGGLRIEIEDRVLLALCPRCTTLVEGVVLRDILSKAAARELAKIMTSELRGLK